MRRVFLRVGFSLVFLASVGSAGMETIVQGWISTSRVLAGHVEVVGTPVADVMIEVRSSDGRTVLASTKTDVNGFFRLDPPKVRGLLHLHLSAPGLNPYELRVRIRKNGDPELRIHMANAT